VDLVSQRANPPATRARTRAPAVQRRRALLVRGAVMSSPWSSVLPCPAPLGSSSAYR